MRRLLLAVVAALAILLASSAIAGIYECMNQFGDKVFTNAPQKPSWMCTDPSNSLSRKSFFEKLSDECVSEVLSSCRALDIQPNPITQGPFVSLSCVIDNTIAPDFKGAPMSVRYNEQRNAATVNDQQATHVSITETTLSFRWGSTTQGTITIDRFSGRFNIGSGQNPVLASGRCERAVKPLF